jgi:integration host factor subunit alpha
MAQSSELPDHRAAATEIAQRLSTAVTRADLIEAVYRRVGLSRAESAKVVELVLKEITDCLVRRNPKTGVEVPITPRRVMRA